jgi:hypothetical protein
LKRASLRRQAIGETLKRQGAISIHLPLGDCQLARNLGYRLSMELGPLEHDSTARRQFADN